MGDGLTADHAAAPSRRTDFSYCAKVDSLLTRSGRVCGARVATGEGETLEVRARTVVNATGVWTDQVDSMADEGHRPQVRPAKGVHIVVPWEKVRINCTVTVPIPGRARRATCTRWGNAVVLGTTDEDYQGSADDVHCTRQEMEFLLEGANTAFEGKLGPQDVVGSIGGLRPLVGGKEGATLDMRRDHHITVGASGMVTVTGGKLTTSRHMGELVVDKVMALLGRKGRSRTANLPLLGGAGYDAEAVAASGGLAAHLGERYGTEARFVGDLIAEDPGTASEAGPRSGGRTGAGRPRRGRTGPAARRLSRPVTPPASRAAASAPGSAPCPARPGSPAPAW
ncbi:FAD-dependent oxidoreductase [Streptomyces albidoflavus]|nr:FAD-dependent oxidoreductase [Streptomyces albidoflavus]WTC39404.1 FAD-dependent oxidoreductase [Streptomyces albidoflavus]WTC40149.1 FAD-dependent oxidoreductase [Streptomyces albidoflavus]WTD45426.1 FAD-dependent oxidoreductase [Streptomyces albidoflavus]WTD80301.1 FAD-dependent oxidoreductase [Streptomyces albidoflavus]